MAEALSERQFAKLVGASLSAVQDRRKAGLLTKSARQDGRGRWRIDPVAGLDEWTENAPLRASSSGDGDMLRAWREARTRYETARAALAEDELRKSRGELAEVAKFEAAWVGMITRSRNKLMGIPSTLRQRDPTITLAQVALVEALIREALEDLAANGGSNGGR